MTRTKVAVFTALTLLAGIANAQVNVTTSLPATVAPGAEFTVEVMIDKGAIAGFAKLQQDLPTGFEATAGENATATFSFKDRKVKYLWMALPNDAKFKVSYKVKVDPTVTGSQIIEGNFSYIKDNNTEKFLIAKDIISVQGESTQASNQAEMMAADSKRKDEEAAAARKAADEQQKTAAAEPAKSETAASEPAKSETAAEPAKSETAAEPAKTSDDSAKKAEYAAKADEARKAASAKKAEEKRVADDAAAAKKAEKSAASETAKTNFNDAMLKTKDGLVFRVQIAAGPHNVEPETLKTKYNIAEAVSVTQHEGLNKYIVGEFGSYRAAKTFCNTLRDTNSVPGPFVTAYNNGERIDVKRALEIAGQ